MALMYRWLPPLSSLLLCGAWLLTGCTLPPVAEAADCGNLVWRQINNSMALCNDYTQAGYFMNLQGGEKWLIFFEGGSLCYSNDTCNRRFFQRGVRNRFNQGTSLNPFGNFDTEKAWRETVGTAGNKTEAARSTVSPIMSSLECFQGNPDFFPEQTAEFAVRGRDILDCDCEFNPVFCNYNKVLVPYCSSDLWLGSDTSATNTSCSCFEYVQNNPSGKCDFMYEPTSPGLQFTFRGETIFRSVIEDFINSDKIHQRSEVVLAGSSAGGVGVINNARWVNERFKTRGGGGGNLKVLFDSAWFINFQGSINQEFENVRNSAGPQSGPQQPDHSTLLSVIASHEVCSDMHRGYPCCLSADCVFTRSSNLTGEPYYPDIPTFGIVSLYDVFLLAPRLAGLSATSNNSDVVGVGLVLDFVTTVGEYGGAMNASIVRVTQYMSAASNYLSLYLTSCLQHIYLATSTLWGREGQSVFGSNAVETSGNTAAFS